MIERHQKVSVEQIVEKVSAQLGGSVAATKILTELYFDQNISIVEIAKKYHIAYNRMYLAIKQLVGTKPRGYNLGNSDLAVSARMKSVETNNQLYRMRIVKEFGFPPEVGLTERLLAYKGDLAKLGSDSSFGEQIYELANFLGVNRYIYQAELVTRASDDGVLDLIQPVYVRAMKLRFCQDMSLQEVGESMSITTARVTEYCTKGLRDIHKAYHLYDKYQLIVDRQVHFRSLVSILKPALKNR